MAVKSSGRIIRKERKNALNCRCQESVRDEIALKDEILDLKRQVVFLKRTNERNLVKFRKYEDEAKRKDREIEQLMDPRKNAEITKMLSTKGAAILMNLKDQNNSLNQMILMKDNQIRRLVAEIKTAKLYGGGASRKTETHRAELIRLGNLLVKSHEILKGNLDQRQYQNGQLRSKENSVSEKSPVSDGFFPREIDELKFTIQSLETHVKYSNELLAQKNHEIINLTEELNDLRKIVSSTEREEKLKEENSENRNGCSHQRRFSISYRKQPSGRSPSISQCQTARDDISEWFEKTLRLGDGDEQPESPAAGSSVSLPSGNSSLKHNSPSRTLEEILSNPEESLMLFPGEISNGEETIIPWDGNEIKSSQTFDVVISNAQKNSPKRVKERRKCSLMKCNQFKKQISNGEAGMMKGKGGRKKRKESWSKNIRENSESRCNDSNLKDQKPIEDEFSERKIFSGSDFQKVKCQARNKETKSEEEVENKNEILIRLQETCRSKIEIHNSAFINTECEKKEDSKEITEESKTFLEFDCPNSNINNSSSGRESARSRVDAEGNSEPTQEKKDCDSSLENFTAIPEKIMTPSRHKERFEYDNRIESGQKTAETHEIKKEICSMASRFSPEVQRELQNLYDNLSTYEELETAKDNSLMEAYQRQSFDSSLESENGYPTTNVTRLVRVEVEINLVQEEIKENLANDSSEKLEMNCESNIAEIDIDGDVDDDDDVIVRQRRI